MIIRYLEESYNILNASPAVAILWRKEENALINGITKQLSRIIECIHIKESLRSERDKLQVVFNAIRIISATHHNLKEKTKGSRQAKEQPS